MHLLNKRKISKIFQFLNRFEIILKFNLSRRKSYEICPDWLIRTASNIENGETTITKACQNVQIIVKDKLGFRHLMYRSISPSTIRREFERNGIKITNLKKGRPKTKVLMQFKQHIINIQKESKMGVSKVYEQIVLNSQSNPLSKHITHSMVYDVFKENELLKYSKPIEEDKKYRCRYEANYPDLIWHTDLHHFYDQYLIAFIDDYSRYVVHCEMIPNKFSLLTKKVLEISIERCNNIPYSIWTDNGKEFKGEFKKYLDKKKIIQVLTKPYNPEQNGKCERFWKTANNCKNIDELKKWVNVYNSMPHFGLPKIIVNGRQTHCSPIQRYLMGQRWNPNISPTWTVDGVSKEFKPWTI